MENVASVVSVTTVLQLEDICCLLEVEGTAAHRCEREKKELKIKAITLNRVWLKAKLCLA